MTPTQFLEVPPNEITLFPEPVLLAKAQEILDFNKWDGIFEIMYDLMKAKHGCGLAAPQVGLSYRAFVLGTTKNPTFVINPEIIEYGDKQKSVEGCLSLPGQIYEVERAKKIKVKWKDLSGKEKRATFEGFTSICFQHEFDHLSGILINKESPP